VCGRDSAAHIRREHAHIGQGPESVAAEARNEADSFVADADAACAKPNERHAASDIELSGQVWEFIAQ
jgi:hypothetical protein